MRLAHVSVTAHDAEALARFYQSAFGFVEKRPLTRLSGAHVYRGNGLPGVDLSAVWLHLPDAPVPFLEILSYDVGTARGRPRVNDAGFGHLAFDVADLSRSVARVLACGGALQGEITDFGAPGRPHLIVYVRDPEGNILELEQRPA